MRGTSLHRLLWQAIGVCLPALAAVGLVSADRLAAQSEDAVTFAKDVAPILQKSCQKCHQPGTSAPMSLLTYEQVKAFAPLIKVKVQTRKMPPWPMDKSIGIQEFKNDISLTDEEIETIVKWIDGGTPLGNPADMPPPADLPDPAQRRWAYEDVFGRPPDVVISSPPYKVVANGMNQWPDPKTDVTGLASERWIRAVGVRPGNPKSQYVFHHANPSLNQDGENNSLVQTAVGTEGYIYPDDAGMLIKPGASVSFGMHFYPIDEDIDAVMELGLWFYPEGEKPKFETPGEVLYEIAQNTGFGFEHGTTRGNARGHSTDPQIVRRGDLLLAPNSQSVYRGVYVMDRPARIHSLRGHMHLRGKYQIVEAVYPDGRWEVINKLDWDHPWHTAFLYEEDAMPLLPKGTVLILTSIFDNTAANPYNPDPEQWVVAGDRTADEMSHLRFGITYFENEEDFQKIVTEREQRLKQRQIAQNADN